jgi:ribosomal-protein-alanine N-acetyltransferase
MKSKWNEMESKSTSRGITNWGITNYEYFIPNNQNCQISQIYQTCHCLPSFSMVFSVINQINQIYQIHQISQINHTKMYLRILNPDEDKTDPLFQSEDCQNALEIYSDYYPQVGFNLPWVAYLIVRDDEVVGTCGFTGKPQNDRVEVAYWTFAAFEGQGIASFACEELIKIALASDPAIVITAKTAPEQNASTKILSNNNFKYDSIVQDHEIGNAWLWVYCG